jgi:uncharacterized protein (UPF0332 family)
MSLARDLLEQAEHLSRRERRRPRQASLRRAVSTGYYALFHLLVDEASRLFTGGGQPERVRAFVARSFQHTTMKEASERVRTGSLFAELSGLGRVPEDLRTVARVFVSLQQARHEADYDLSASFKRSEVLRLLKQVRLAFDSWQRVRHQATAKAYLAALLSVRGWKR